MNEISFKPVYNLQNKLAVIIPILFGGWVVYKAYIYSSIDNTLDLFAWGSLFILIGVYIFVAHPREFVFTQTQVILKRLFLPELIFEYRDFTDMSSTSIRFGRRRGIALVSMKNGGDLLLIFQKLIDERKIQPSQIQGKLAVEEALEKKASMYSIIPGFVLGFIVLMLLGSYFNLGVYAELVISVSVLFTSIVIYLFLKRRYENKE